MLAMLLKPLVPFLVGNSWLTGPNSLSAARRPSVHVTAMSEPYKLELIRSYASAGFTAVVTINSGALIACLSQAANLDFVSPAAIGCALLTWALGVTTGVATWGAAYQAVVAHTWSDPEGQLLWTRIATKLFHFSLFMFLLGFVAIALPLLW